MIVHRQLKHHLYQTPLHISCIPLLKEQLMSRTLQVAEHRWDTLRSLLLQHQTTAAPTLHLTLRQVVPRAANQHLAVEKAQLTKVMASCGRQAVMTSGLWV